MDGLGGRESIRERWMDRLQTARRDMDGCPDRASQEMFIKPAFRNLREVQLETRDWDLMACAMKPPPYP